MRAGLVEVTPPQLVHELLDERGALLTHQLLPGPQVWLARAPFAAPVAERVDDRQGLDAGLGEAVPDPLSSCCIVADEDACGDESTTTRWSTAFSALPSATTGSTSPRDPKASSTVFMTTPRQ